MAPIPSHPHRSRLIYGIFSLLSTVFSFARRTPEGLSKRDNDSDLPQYEKILYPILIAVLVLLSGLFAGLTLGYMSLDQTQLNVLSVSGTPEQQKYAQKIKPIRENGHLLLVTLLLANMIVNETLPVIADPILGGGVQSVVVSTVLIVIFSEILPQSLFSRHGLYLGAKAAGLTRVLIWGLGIVSWPVAKFLDWVLGEHHGIIYRRVELKELIAMHSYASSHGGDLKADTVTIINHTLDLQEKVVSQAMTPLSDVFMLSIDSKLDSDLLKKIVETGHSRIPVYEEVVAPSGVSLTSGGFQATRKMQKIVGILLVKQCVLLDPKDATPIRNLQLNRVPFIPMNEPLLGILDKFQEGRSHMAIVSRFSVDSKAKFKSVKKAVKQSLTQRLKEMVVSSDSDSTDTDNEPNSESEDAASRGDEEALHVDVSPRSKKCDSSPGKEKKHDGVARGRPPQKQVEVDENKPGFEKKKFGISNLEASMPADAVLTVDSASDFLQGFDPAIMPLGIITLEDVLEELIGEDIYDEFDAEGAHGETYIYQPPQPTSDVAPSGPINKSLAHVKSMSFFRSRTSSLGRDSEKSKGDPGSSELNSPASSNSIRAFRTSTPTKPQPALKTDSHPSLVAPSPIEAVLLDRRRRLGPASTWTADSSGKGSPSRSGPKGKFKSGPLKKSFSNPADLLGSTPESRALTCPAATPTSASGRLREKESTDREDSALDLTLVRTLTDRSDQ